ncbi:citrate lyase acyl carrier protein [Thermosinus carboxydivorans Nor1]|uniref:Citrate lyase acyl carrier protein n=1 Tax=Thermosinus carboxydivorans Nor1 TaxID=401526 RepID=A1HPP7_9FIRM|nr:citrate lyase acyl carrier protein [Thermosinus carboxydivorans]EAX48017.1 citrate lyase acyl carrier protein [Thermosinus carboxydivorans Nor1]
MGRIMRSAQAGTLESNDIMITVTPGAPGSGTVIELESIVLLQYGEAIRQTLAAVVAETGIDDIYIKAVDRGALDCTIRARMLAALARAGAVLKEDMA